MGQPLHELEEPELCLLGPPKIIERGFVHAAPRRGPFPPWTFESAPQHLETRKSRQRRTTGTPKPIERVAPVRIAGLTEVGIRKPEGPYLRIDDQGIIDRVGASKIPDALLQRGDSQARKFRHCRKVDVQGVEKQTAAREIRTWLRGSIIEQGVQRVEPYAGGAEIGGKIDEREEIGEVAVAPITGRADAVKLHGERPHPLRRGCTALTAPIRTNNERSLLAPFDGRAGCRYTQAERAGRQVLRNSQQG